MPLPFTEWPELLNSQHLKKDPQCGRFLSNFILVLLCLTWLCSADLCNYVLLFLADRMPSWFRLFVLLAVRSSVTREPWPNVWNDRADFWYGRLGAIADPSTVHIVLDRQSASQSHLVNSSTCSRYGRPSQHPLSSCYICVIQVNFWLIIGISFSY